MIKSCDDIRDIIGAWLDGELSRSGAEEVRVHLESCSFCREERRQLERLQTSLERVLAAGPANLTAEVFWRGVERRIKQRRAWREDFVGWLGELSQLPRLAWFIPAVIVLLLVVMSLDSFLPGLRLRAQRNNFAAVDSIDAFGRNVAVLRDDETKTTVIWLYQNQEGEDEPTGDKSEASPSF